MFFSEDKQYGKELIFTPYDIFDLLLEKCACFRNYARRAKKIMSDTSEFYDSCCYRHNLIGNKFVSFNKSVFSAH